ncbi:MAG: peptidylprolyl isomerase [Candidatus Paceibacterota bacterium]
MAENTNGSQEVKTSNIVIKTNYGEIEVVLLDKETPNTAANFLKLAKDGFYNGTKFHRVIQGFMIQGGDPLSKDAGMKSRWGTGDPGYKFNDELTGQEKYPQGTLAMANSGPNTNGSQFFIVTATPEAPLPPSYTVFGRVVGGMDTALKIEKVATESNDRPVKDVVIESMTVR